MTIGPEGVQLCWTRVLRVQVQLSPGVPRLPEAFPLLPGYLQHVAGSYLPKETPFFLSAGKWFDYLLRNYVGGRIFLLVCHMCLHRNLIIEDRPLLNFTIGCLLLFSNYGSTAFECEKKEKLLILPTIFLNLHRSGLNDIFANINKSILKFNFKL